MLQIKTNNHKITSKCLMIPDQQVLHKSTKSKQVLFACCITGQVSFYVNGEGYLTPDSKDNNTETSSGSGRYDISDNSADEHDETSELPADGNTQSTIPSEPRSVPPSAKRRCVRAKKDVNFLKSRSETRPAASQQKKASELFFESLIPEFEKLPVQEQRDFKLEILTSLDTRLQKYNL
jgi:hypothetical protein